MMYNEELKMAYITEKESTTIIPKHYLKNEFNKISKVEYELEKDARNFTKREIIEYYKTRNFINVDSVGVLNSILSQYVQWCLQRNLVTDNQNHYLEIDRDIMKSCLNMAIYHRRIISRERIEEICSQLINPRDKVIFMCLFEGIKGKDFCEIVNLKPSDIKGNKTYLCTNRIVEITDVLKGYIDQCIDEKMYYSVTGTQAKVMPLINRGYIIKDYPNTKDETNDFYKGRALYNSILRSLKSLGLFRYLSSTSIYISGQIDMINKMAQEENLSAKEVIYSDRLKKVEEKYNCNINKKQFILKYEEHLL